MKKTGTIVVYFLLFAIVITIFFLIPKDTLKTSDSIDMNLNKSVKISLYRVDSFYEEREEVQNRRVITVYVDKFSDSQEVWMQIFDYANKLPLTWGGYTAVFFFNNRTYTPLVPYFTEQFDEVYEDHCVAGYWKYSNGTDIFRQYPFKQQSL